MSTYATSTDLKAMDMRVLAPEDDVTSALEDASSKDRADYEAPQQSGLVGYITERFTRAEQSRLTHETRWMRSYRNYRGMYGPDVQFTETEKSRVFIKVTKTKTLAAFGQLIDVLFAGNKFPISVDPTKLPEGVVEAVHVDPKAQKTPEPTPPSNPFESLGYEGDGKSLPPGATFMDMLGPLEEKLSGLDLKEGYGATPSAVTFEPAVVAAKRMEKKIHDQLDESKASEHLRLVAFETVLFGTGCMKGPFTSYKEYPRWVQGEGGAKYDPIIKKMPMVESVSVWDMYPDPDALMLSEAEYVVQRHKMSRSQLRALKKRPYFRESAIEATIYNGPNYIEKWWENTLRDYQNTSGAIERYEVLEYWGTIDADIARDADIDIPEEFEDFDEIHINAWICGNQVLRLVINPFKPNKIPFNMVPYELNPYSIFGIGVPENMEDTQSLMNGFMRLAIDNAALSGNVVFEVDESSLVPGQDLRVWPGKVFRRQAGAPGQAIFGTKFPNTTNENLQVFDKARQLADEATGIPSFSHGQTGVSGVGRTAAGISMLMGASATAIKTVVKNMDDFLLRPLGEFLFQWNMQFDYDPELTGDLEVSARGTESLLKNEVRSQRLMQFMQTGQNPNTAPFIKWQYLIREIALMLDLDPEKVCNNMDEATIQALMMQKMGGQPVGGAEGGAPGSNPMDPTGAGGGTPGIGMAPTPGEPGFAANTGQGAAPNQPPAQPPMGGMA